MNLSKLSQPFAVALIAGGLSANVAEAQTQPVALPGYDFATPPFTVCDSHGNGLSVNGNVKAPDIATRLKAKVYTETDAKIAERVALTIERAWTDAIEKYPVPEDRQTVPNSQLAKEAEQIIATETAAIQKETGVVLKVASVAWVPKGGLKCGGS